MLKIYPTDSQTHKTQSVIRRQQQAQIVQRIHGNCIDQLGLSVHPCLQMPSCSGLEGQAGALGSSGLHIRTQEGR